MNSETPFPAPSHCGSPPRYRWLLFDADGTLFNFEKAEGEALERAFRQSGVPYRPEHLALYQRFNQSLWQAVERGEIQPPEVKVRRFELLLEALKLDGSAAEMGSRYLQCLAECPDLLEGAAEVIGALRRRYQIAIVTNGLKEVQRGRLARSELRPHISELIISEEVGSAKPAKEFFDITFARLGRPPKREALVIGDNWASDIAGAVQYGLDACWYNPGRKPRPAAPEITREVASLRELADWLA